MTQEQLWSEATCFRKAIVNAKENGAFPCKSRLVGFPVGCCDDTADLFSQYLLEKHNIISTRIDGAFRDGNPEHSQNHSWQEVFGLIVDLTGSQPAFRYSDIFLHYDHDVYIGPVDDFHKLFKVERKAVFHGFDSFPESSQSWMKELYSIIIHHMG